MNYLTFIINMFSKTPIWVWILFAYLIHTGVRGLVPQKVDLTRLFIMPIVFSLMKGKELQSVTDQTLLIYLCGLIFSGVVGYLLTKEKNIKIFKEELAIEIPGSSYFLLSTIIIFVINYYFGYNYARYPESKASLQVFDLVISSSFSGFFLGRAIKYCTQYVRQKNHTPSHNLN